MQNDDQSTYEKAYGCIQVKVGDEEDVAETIEKLFPEIEVHTIKQLKHKSRGSIRSHSLNNMLPGYILINADSEFPVRKILSISSVFSILNYENHEWHLRGEDLFYAKWIYENKGLIGISMVYAEGDEVRIMDGPLKAVEGKIIRIDKRNRNAQISLGCKLNDIKVWLAFEWMEKAKS